MAIAPNNDVYAGGIELNKRTSTGGFDNLSDCPNFHDDINELTLPGNQSESVYVAHDGGVSIFKNSLTGGCARWKNLTGNLNLSQFYDVALFKGMQNFYIGGTHDNGTYRLFLNQWARVNFGDGGSTIINYNNSAQTLSTCNSRVERSINTGATFPKSVFQLVNYDCPIIQNPQNSENVFFCDWHLAMVPKVWTKTNPKGKYIFICPPPFNYNVRNFAIAAMDTNTIYLSVYNREAMINGVYKTTNYFSNPTTGINISTYVNSVGQNNILFKARVTDIKIHPYNKNIVWITFGNFAAGHKVYQTINGGTSWTNISGTLPNLPVNCIVYHDGTDGLFIGNDLGVYYKSLSATDWSLYGTGLPKVLVSDLEIDPVLKRLVAATYGRGIYRIDIDCATPSAPTDIASNATGGTLYNLCVNTNYTLTATARAQPSSVYYKWFCDNINITSGQGSKVITMKPLSAGSSTIRIDAINSCGFSRYTENASFKTCTALTFSIYPNPAQDYINVAVTETNNENLVSTEISADEPYEVTLFDKDQTAIFKKKTKERKLQINTKQYPSGNYFLHFNFKDEKTRLQVIIEKK